MSYIGYTKNMNYEGDVSMLNFNNSIIKKEKATRQNNYDKTKTQFCKSLTDGLKCVYGEKCNYAHSISELRITMCNYPDTCFKIYLNNEGELLNCNKQKCRFLHSFETKENYIKRNCMYYRKPEKIIHERIEKENVEINKAIKISKAEHERIEKENVIKFQNFLKI